MNIKLNASKETVLKATNDCSCSACSTGCQFGSGFFTAEQLPEVANHLKMTEEKLKKQFLEPSIIFQTELFRPKFNKPFGKCTFFEDNKCSINDVKPLQCKVAMNCKPYAGQLHEWFYFNHARQEGNMLSMSEFETYKKHQHEIHNPSNQK